MKKNPLKNFIIVLMLNLYAKTAKRMFLLATEQSTETKEPNDGENVYY